MGYGFKTGGANTGPRNTCDPPQLFQWPVKAFRIFKSSNLKFVEKRVALHLTQWIACAW